MKIDNLRIAREIAANRVLKRYETIQANEARIYTYTTDSTGHVENHFVWGHF